MTVEFAFTEDQELLRNTVREFAEAEIAPDNRAIWQLAEIR